MRYRQQYDGDWVYPRRRGYRAACCDCGLVHVFNFKLVKDRIGRGKIKFQVFRDDKATAKRRKRKGR